MSDVGKKVSLAGWVENRRDHGGLIFVDLRDREGLTQIVFDPAFDEKTHELAQHLRGEWVMSISGLVNRRPEGMTNGKLATGAVEVRVEQFQVLAQSKTPPFPLDDYATVHEDLRLRYRYLDLRRPRLQENLKKRHQTTMLMRNFLSDRGFYEIETPMLTKSTPEGARDYLVPSRVHPGKFFALPQSPQLFKQLLMVSGMERYFQIVKCFRDEDLRADRQPEFTQLDVEMSFVDREDIFQIVEDLVADIFKDIGNINLKKPFRRMAWKEAMDSYGSDKPDIRFEQKIIDCSDIFAKSGFKVFAETISRKGFVKALNIKGGARYSRKEIDDLGKIASQYGAKGMAWIKILEQEWQSPIVKFFSDAEKNALIESADLKSGDLISFIADDFHVTHAALGSLRLDIARIEKLIPENHHEILWVTDFPLFDFDAKENRYVACHHPFTHPLDEDIQFLESDPGKVRAKAYDLVLDGQEIGGGSIRIHAQDLQQKIFDRLGLTREEAHEKFGFLLEAFTFGAPPHGGIALGLDRIMMILTQSQSIREVIAFPKTQKASCLLTEAPSAVSSRQLEDLSIRVKIPEPTAKP